MIFHRQIKDKIFLKKRIHIINVRNAIDIGGKPVGHAVKTMHEIEEILRDSYEISVMASKELCDEFNKTETIKLPFKKKYSRKRNVISEFLSDFFNCIISFFKASRSDCLWHVIVSEALFWAIALMPKGKHTIIITIYQDYERYFATVNTLKVIRNRLFRKACKKIDLCIVTNKNFHMPIKTIFIPDYYISDEEKKLSRNEKQDIVVCLGQMRESRELDKVVEVFNKTLMQVYIIGQFGDREWYERLIDAAEDNIHIENRLVEDEEYYQLLSEAKYSILPYNMKIYRGRTSGVLLESLFLGSTPIAPKELLEYNGIKGIAYETLDDVPRLINACLTRPDNDMSLYDFGVCKKKILEELSKIMKVREESI